MTEPILCEKCMAPLGANLITLPYATVEAMRQRIAQLEADAAIADRTIAAQHAQSESAI